MAASHLVQTSISLKPALDAIGRNIDQRFDRLLPVPGDGRDRLYEAMRHATIGGGKRMRPLLVVAACGPVQCRPRARPARRHRDRGGARLQPDPRRPAVHGR